MDQPARRIDPAAVERLCGTEAKLELLLESDRWPAERIRRYQEERLDELVGAARRSPFWRDRIGPDDALADIEPMTAGELRDERGRIRVQGPEPVIELRTTGSTGSARMVELGAESVGFWAATRLRHRSWFGLAPRDATEAGLHVHATASSPAVRRTQRSPAHFLLNPWRLEGNNLAEAHRAIVDGGGVEILGGMGSMTAAWAGAYRDSNLDPLELGAELVSIGGDLCYPDERALIAETFGCPLGEWYGAREAPIVAVSCPEGSLHINEERVLVEIIKADGTPAPPGEPGVVLTTLLHNTEFPLIRYRLGDMAARLEGPCACGRTLARLALEVGRLDDAAVRADGGLVHPVFLKTIYANAVGSSLRAMYTVQSAADRFQVHLDIDGSPPADLRQAIETELGSLLGAPVRVELVLGEAAETALAQRPKRRAFHRAEGVRVGDGAGLR